MASSSKNVSLTDAEWRFIFIEFETESATIAVKKLIECYRCEKNGK